MTDSPRTQEQWLELLVPLQLPLNTELRAQALAAIDEGNASAADLSTLLLDDPAAVLLIFREANAALARYERETHGLEHAFSLLGMARVRKLLQNAPTLAANHPFTREYRQAQQRSLHAAWQARLWAEGTGRWPADEMFWDTLLAGAPHWLLWLETGSQRLKLSKLRAQRGFVTAAESHELFGCNLNALMAELTVQWRLPLNSQMSWRTDIIGNRRDWITLAHAAHMDSAPELPKGSANELSHQPSLIVALANLLAVEADWDWYNRHFLRLLAIVASCCRRPLSTLINFTHQTAASFSRSYHGDLQTPAARLLCYWQQAHVWAPPRPAAPAPAASVAPSSSTSQTTTPQSATPQSAPAEAAKSPTEGTRLLAAALRRLQQPASLSGAREALTITLDALQAGTGLQRLAALIYRAEAGELSVLLGRGIETSPALRQLKLRSKDSALLEQLLRKPVCLRLGDDNHARYWPLFPESFRTAVRSQQFLLSSIIANERPIALLFADNNGNAVTDDQHRLFRQLGIQLCQCLQQMGKAG